MQSVILDPIKIKEQFRRPAIGLLGAFVFSICMTSAGTLGDSHRFLGEMSVTDLPAEARETLALIRKGGPYPYARDGIVFANRERLLPSAPRGTYREFTVRTPGRRERGARRIIAGAREQFYYTDDHYRSFKRILE